MAEYVSIQPSRLIPAALAAAIYLGSANSFAQQADQQDVNKEYQELQTLIGKKRTQEHRSWEATKPRIGDSLLSSGGDNGPTTVRGATATSAAATAGTAGFSGNSMGVPYAQWSEGQKAELARELKDKSNQDCAAYQQQAAQGVVRASYEAAACLYKTYYHGTPADYPGREQLKQGFYDSAQKARQLNSTAPVIQGGF